MMGIQNALICGNRKAWRYPQDLTRKAQTQPRRFMTGRITPRSLSFAGGVSTAALATGLFAGMPSASSQIACIAGTNANACTVAPGTAVPGNVNTNGNNHTIGNAGTITGRIRTLGVNSEVTNSGSVGTNIRTNGDNSRIINSGPVGTNIRTTGASSSVTNSGIIGKFIRTNGANSGVINSGSVGTNIRTNGASSSVTNSGIIGKFIRTNGANSGVINSGSVGTNIRTNGASSSVTNSGIIGKFIRTNGANSGVINSGSVGTNIRTTNANSSVTNSGSVGSGAVGDGIFIEGLNPTLTLLPGSLIQGDIDLSGAGVRTLNVGNSLSIALTFITGPDIFNSNGAPFARNANMIAVVNPTNLAVQDELLVDQVGGIFSTVQNRLGALRNDGVAGVTTTPRLMSAGASGASKYSDMVEDNRRQAWAQAFGSYRLQREHGPNVDSDIRMGGLVSGFDGVSSGGTRLGVFFGGSTGNVDAEFNSQETDVDSLFGGFYASTLKGNTAIDFAITVGYSDYDRERRVANNLSPTGLQKAEASYDGWFVSPELTLTRPLWAGAQRFEKSLILRYAGLFLDGFTETGAADALSINDRDVHVLQARTQLTMPVVREGADGSSHRSAFFIGLEGRAQISDQDISGTLLAQNITFNPGGDDAVAGAYAGLEFERTSARGTTFFASVEGQVETGGGRQASGKIGMKFRF